MKSVRAIWNGAAAAGVAALAFAVAGCGAGGIGAGAGEAERAFEAIAGLYVIDHAGANPTDDVLAPYTEAFRRVQEGCNIGADELANSIIQVAGDASNGSGTSITNLEALRAVARHLDTAPENVEDCGGVFVAVEARLEGGALDN